MSCVQSIGELSIYCNVHVQGTGINRGGLFIRNTQFYHAGKYRCIAKSTSDVVITSATLTVIGALTTLGYLAADSFRQFDISYVCARRWKNRQSVSCNVIVL